MSRRTWTGGRLLVAVVAAIAMPGGTASAQAVTVGRDAAIARGIVIDPDTVRVGDPFRLVVRIRAPREAAIEFPAGPDSGTGVEALDPVQITPVDDSTAVEQIATYRLAAWDVGRLPIRLADVLVRDGDAVRRVPLGNTLGVTVLSVLPPDSAQRVPRPPRMLYHFGPPWWWWALVALAAAVIGGVLWWWWRRRRDRPAAQARTPYEQAMDEFARIEALELIAAGERGHHVALMGDVVRRYLAAELPAATTSLTTTELAHLLRGERRVPFAPLTRLLHDLDLVKFAGARVETDRAVEMGAEARALIETTDSALHPPDRREAA